MGEKPQSVEALTLSPKQIDIAKKVLERIDGGRTEVKRFIETLVDFTFGSNTPSNERERMEAIHLLGIIESSQKVEVFKILQSLSVQITKKVPQIEYKPDGALHPLKQKDAVDLLRKIPGGLDEKLRFCQTLVNYVLGSNTPDQPEMRKMAVELFGDLPSTPENKRAAYLALKMLIDEMHPKVKDLTDSDVCIIGTNNGSPHALTPFSDSDTVLSDDDEYILGVGRQITKPGKNTSSANDDHFWEAIESEIPNPLLG